MSWKNLKIFAIAVLFVMNLFFGIEVYMQNKRMNFYSEKEIASVRGLLSESGLQIKEDYLRAKKVSPPAYMRRYGDGELLASVKSVFGNVESDGDALTAVSGGIYRFGAGDGFEYRSSEDSPLPEEILENGNVSAIFMFDSYSERLETAMKKVMRIESINALPQNKKAEKTSASLYRLYVTDDGKYFVSVFLQYIGKMQTSQAFSLVIDADGNVVSGNGTFSLLLPTEKLNADWSTSISPTRRSAGRTNIFRSLRSRRSRRKTGLSFPRFIIRMTFIMRQTERNIMSPSSILSIRTAPRTVII